MAWEKVIPSEQDKQNETIWALWLWADDTLKPGCEPHNLIKKLAQPQIDDLDESSTEWMKGLPGHSGSRFDRSKQTKESESDS